MATRRALVVDDEEGMRSLVTEFLQDEDFEVESCATVADALAALQKTSFDLLLADLKIYEGSGLDLIREARVVRPDMAAIIMTGFGTVENARSAIKEGAYDFVLKPFDLDELRLSVRNALERKRLAEENVRLRELTGLLQTSEALTALLEETKLPHLVLGSALAQTKATRGYILISQPGNEGLEIASVVGWPDDAVARLRRKTYDGPLCPVCDGAETVLVTANTRHPLREKVRCYLPNSCRLALPLGDGEEMLSIPLKTRKNIIGLLNVTRNASQPRFSEVELQLLSILARHSAVAIENSRLMASAQDAYLSTFSTLVGLIEARDPYTHGHSQRVTRICAGLARDMNLPRDRGQALEYAASLHDIGKVGISEAILNKPYQLEEREWRDIRRHPEIGFNILEPIKFLGEARQIILHHHERCDGSGYPSGLSSRDLTMSDHVLIVADMFDAMNSDRAYRKRLDTSEILATLQGQMGLSLDAGTVEAFIKRYNDGGFAEL
jgi:response regulator RpfG family c-di-GMP phosphodiesterase